MTWYGLALRWPVGMLRCAGAADVACSAYGGRGLRHRFSVMHLAMASASVQVGLLQRVQAATRQLCHRQATWFRSHRKFRWIDASRGCGRTADAILQLVSASSENGARSGQAQRMLGGVCDTGGCLVYCSCWVCPEFLPPSARCRRYSRQFGASCSHRGRATSPEALRACAGSHAWGHATSMPSTCSVACMHLHSSLIE